MRPLLRSTADFLKKKKKKKKHHRFQIPYTGEGFGTRSYIIVPIYGTQVYYDVVNRALCGQSFVTIL